MAEPVTDSRFPGFNPEVEESKAAEAEALKAMATSAAASGDAPAAEPPTPHRCIMCGGQFAEKTPVCPSCGAGYEMES